MSNSLKFTEQGSVTLRVSVASNGWNPHHEVLNQAPMVVAFEVTDTGIGIPLEKQKIIFEAFQQADARTSRKYGGTGLGLAICRELANLLGGELTLRSSPGSGSTFILYLPIRYAGSVAAQRTPSGGEQQPSTFRQMPRIPERPIEHIPDDRLDIQPGDPTLLIVEDDPHYARILAGLARDQDFKVLIAARGADAIDLAQQYSPSAISLDVFLPDTLGWNVLSQLKQNPETRHIPVQVVTSDEDRQHGLSRGAFSFLTKPANAQDLENELDPHPQLCRPPAKAAARGRGQCGRADEHHRTARARRRRNPDRHDRQGVPGGHPRRDLRLRGSRSAAAGPLRLRRAEADRRRT